MIWSGIAAQPARRQQMIGDRRAQFAAAARVAVMQMLGAEARIRRPAKDLKRCKARPSICVQPSDNVPCCGASMTILVFARAMDARRNARGDKCARADGSDRKSVRDQSLIGRRDGVAAKAGLFCQRARRRQRFAGFHDPADDGVAQRLIEPMLRGGTLGDMRAEKVERQLGLARRRRENWSEFFALNWHYRRPKSPVQLLSDCSPILTGAAVTEDETTHSYPLSSRNRVKRLP